MVTNAPLDFGYPWWLSYGHVAVLVPAAVLLLLGYLRRWRTWPMILLGALAVWSGVALLVMRCVIDINGQPSLPTPNFFRAGRGRILDIGAGTGRSSIMVLQARPEATLVATDLFGDSFKRHFGLGDSPQQRLFANLRAARVDQRARIETADMRELPFESASFDAIVSAYAIDHLNRQGSDRALAEAARVLKPGGDFLLMLVANDAWAKFAFGPLLSHGATRDAAWWTWCLNDTGFQVVEQGSRPITLYLLARRR